VSGREFPFGATSSTVTMNSASGRVDVAYRVASIGPASTCGWVNGAVV
jgi:hypothetical protein